MGVMPGAGGGSLASDRSGPRVESHSSVGSAVAVLRARKGPRPPRLPPAPAGGVLRGATRAKAPVIGAAARRPPTADGTPTLGRSGDQLGSHRLPGRSPGPHRLWIGPGHRARRGSDRGLPRPPGRARGSRTGQLGRRRAGVSGLRGGSRPRLTRPRGRAVYSSPATKVPAPWRVTSGRMPSTRRAPGDGRPGDSPGRREVALAREALARRQAPGGDVGTDRLGDLEVGRRLAPDTGAHPSPASWRSSGPRSPAARIASTSWRGAGISGPRPTWPDELNDRRPWWKLTDVGHATLRP